MKAGVIIITVIVALVIYFTFFDGPWDDDMRHG